MSGKDNARASFIAQSTRKSLLDRIRNAAKMDDESGVRELSEKFRRQYPDPSSEAEQAANEGRNRRKLRDDILNATFTHGKDSEEVKALMKDPQYKHVKYDVEKQKNDRHAAGERSRETDRRAANGIPLTDVKSKGVEHRIWMLPSARRWDVFIDETGDNFLSGQNPNGKIAAIFIPDTVKDLPALPAAFHAAGIGSLDDLDSHFQRLIDARVGMLGIPVKALSGVSGRSWTVGDNLWIDGIEETIYWGLRLLQLPEKGKSTLAVHIEQRGQYKESVHWDPVKGALLQQLAEAEPERARRLSLDIKVYEKGGHPQLGYADLLAFSWGKARGSEARLDASGLKPECLWLDDLRGLADAREALTGSRLVDGEAWRGYLRSNAAAGGNFIVTEMLDRLAVRCRHDARQWQALAEATQRYADGGSVDVNILGRELDWLDACKPKGEALAPLAEFMHLITKLARENHRARTVARMEEEVCRLGDALYMEAAPKVCLGDLRRTVAVMDRFDFEGATEALRRWRDDTSPAIPGLRMWGRTQSQRGQIAACNERWSEAVEYFDRALEAFEKLSSKKERERECKQTLVYRAIALMDNPRCSNTDAYQAFNDALRGRKTKDVIADDSNPFLHYLWVRFLARRGTESERSHYFRYSSSLNPGSRHPWPIILGYRGFLKHQAKHDANECTHLFVAAHRAAYRLADEGDGGPALRLIGAAWFALGRNLGLLMEPLPNWEKEIDALEAALPKAGDRIALLRKGMTKEFTPMSWLSRILPFNYC